MAGSAQSDDAELAEFEALAAQFHTRYEALQKEFAEGDGIDPGEAQILDHLADELRHMRTMTISAKSAIASKSFKPDSESAAGGGGSGASAGGTGAGGGGAGGGGEDETAVGEDGQFAGNTVGGAPPPGAHVGGASGGAVPKDIGGAVGSGGKNAQEDVKAVQLLLNKLGEKLKADGHCGKDTIEAIKKFQKSKLGFSDGRIDPGGKTWKALSGAKAK